MSRVMSTITRRGVSDVSVNVAGDPVNTSLSVSKGAVPNVNLMAITLIVVGHAKPRVLLGSSYVCSVLGVGRREFLLERTVLSTEDI